MAGQNSEEKVEVKEEVECTLNPERSQYLRRSDRGDGTRCFGNCPASCTLTRRQPLWLPQRIVGGTNRTCR
jgi:hypothetical protein